MLLQPIYACVRRGYESSFYFFSYYNLMSTKYVLPVWSSCFSCSFYHLFDSTVFFFLSFFSVPSFQHLVPLWNKKKYYYYYSFSSFITSLIPFFPLCKSRDTTIIVCPIFFFAVFIFLKERSHLVFRLLYN